MRLLQKVGAGAVIVGFLLIVVGGMSVHSGPDGTWVHVNFVHAAGGIVLLFGAGLSVVVAFASGGAKPDLDKAKDIPPPEVNR